MEGLDEQSREMSVSRVLNTGKREENFGKDMLGLFAQLRESQELIQYPEIEKTTQMKELISEINSSMKEFVAEYGGVSVRVEDKHIHIIDRGKMATSEELAAVDSKNITGMFLPRAEAVVIWKIMDGTIVNAASTITHEMLHANSLITYKFDSNSDNQTINDLSINIVHEDESQTPAMLRLRHCGILMVDKGGFMQFGNLNEAITEELNLRFQEKYFHEFNSLKNEGVKKKMILVVCLLLSGKPLGVFTGH